MTVALLAVSIAAVAALVAGARRQPPVPTSTPAAAAARDSTPRMNPTELRDWLSTRPGALFLDVRTPAEFAEGHLQGAQNLDVQAPDFAERVAKLAKDRPVVVYCRSGVRSDRAAGIMRGLGFGEIVNGGGFEALVKGGFTPAPR